jgi:hypothetical protein
VQRTERWNGGFLLEEASSGNARAAARLTRFFEREPARHLSADGPRTWPAGARGMAPSSDAPSRPQIVPRGVV